MADPDPWERAHENASGIASLVVTGVWLSAMIAGFEYWLPLMLFGYVVVVPLASILFDEEKEADEESWDDETADSSPADRTTADLDDDEDDALATLRERYARGELTDEQFERKVERLLETDTLESVEDRHRERTTDRDKVSETE